MYKAEIEEQIKRCKELQAQCQLRDISTFLDLSNQITKLSELLRKSEESQNTQSDSMRKDEVETF